MSGLRAIGDLLVMPVGLGAMTLTQVADIDVDRAVSTVRAALDAGVGVFDTADSYGPDERMGVNESLLAEALRRAGAGREAIVSTKGGHIRGPAGTWGVDGRPEHLRAAARASATRLGVEVIELYHLHRPDVRVPYAESVGALRDLLDAGVIRRAGVSNVDAAQLRIALDVLGDHLVSVSNECSTAVPLDPDVREICADAGLAVLGWGPFGGRIAAGSLAEREPVAAAVARECGVSVQRVVLAWLLAREPLLVPIPGSSRPEGVRDCVAAAHLVLTRDQLARLDAA